MASQIDSKTKRDRLAARREPYWATIQKGAAIGYRKLENGNGTWIARWRDDDGKQKYRALGEFDDFDIASKAAREWVTSCEGGVTHKATTVKEACEAYVSALKAEGRKDTAKDAEGRFNRLVYSKTIGKQALDKLKSSTVQKWRDEQIDDDDEADEEDVRRSKDSANRNLDTLKAALNMALNNRLVSTDAGWKTVKRFPKVKVQRRGAFLSKEQRTALLDACADDLKMLVKAMLLTGARPGELANLSACDYDKGLGCLTLTGKTGPRTVAISTAAATFFNEASKDQIGNAPMLATTFGQRWNKDAWKKVFKESVTAAQLPDTVVMYCLRHTAISEMILAGMDSFVVAKLSGTSVAMIEKTYGHLKHSVITAKLDTVAMF